jgi:hypothetical protein
MDASKLYWFHRKVEQMRLGMKASREIFEAHYRSYQRTGKILEEVAGTTGLNRDHLAHMPAS